MPDQGSEIHSREFEVRTPDGRRLFARLTGPEHGEVVVFLTGTPGTRCVYEGNLRKGEFLGFRHLCISRPGYGDSDRQPDRQIADCAADVAAVADSLGLDDFYVVGHSGGGGHALACAVLLPDRVRSAGVLSTFVPRNADGLDWEANFCEWNIEEFKALRKGDAALRRFLANAVEGMRKVETKEQLRVEFEGGDMFCEADRAALAGPMLDYEFKCRAHIAQEATDGWFDDDKAFYGGWGFDPRGIKVPVTIWFGKDDTIVPLAHGEWFERNLPSARSHFLKGEGHVSYFEQRYGEILEELRAMAR